MQKKCRGNKMKLNVSKEWCMKMAELEGDCEIGAMNPNFFKEKKMSEEEMGGFGEGGLIDGGFGGGGFISRGSDGDR